jgi:hypothetical protein
MSNDSEDEGRLTAELWKPSAVLEAAQDSAVQTAKFLYARRAHLKRLSRRASVDDAIALAELIIALAKHGQKQSATQAIQITLQVDALMQQLAVEMENLQVTK